MTGSDEVSTGLSSQPIVVMVRRTPSSSTILSETAVRRDPSSFCRVRPPSRSAPYKSTPLACISYHIISYQRFIVRPLLRECRPLMHYKSQPNAKTPRKTQCENARSPNFMACNTVENSSVFSLIRMRWFAVSKDTRAVKICTSKILQLLTGGAG